MTNYTKKLNSYKKITTNSEIYEVLRKLNEYNKQIRNYIDRKDIDFDHFKWLQGSLHATFRKLEKDFEQRRQNHETIMLFHVND